MSGVVGATGAAGAAAAAKKAAEMRKEEEEMTPYGNDDLQDWEFKIVRSHTGKFKDRKFLQDVTAQEAKAGWEMLEIFDKYRVRFKRRIEKRKNDQYLDFDPYRTVVGMSEGGLVGMILGIVFGGVAVVLAIVFLLKNVF